MSVISRSIVIVISACSSLYAPELLLSSHSSNSIHLCSRMSSHDSLLSVLMHAYMNEKVSFLSLRIVERVTHLHSLISCPLLLSEVLLGLYLRRFCARILKSHLADDGNSLILD